MNDFQVALCQMHVSESKEKNIAKATSMIRKAAHAGARLVALPEMFNCPYDNSYFRSFAEGYPDGQTIKALQSLARELEICLVGGSIPELLDEKVFNTSLVFNPCGELIARHRKIHLFDVDVPGGISFKESATLQGGDQMTVVDTPALCFGVAICYDMRFPELFRKMVLAGAKLIIVPAAFNMTTGPAHWEPLIRVRAIDNQAYVAAISPARDLESSYVAYGHTMVADPWGKVVGMANEQETIVYFNYSEEQVSQVRCQIPLLKHRRTDIY